MIYHEFQNIKELKANKAYETSKTTSVSLLNEFLLNVSFNQIKVPVNFDLWSWPENMSFKDTS